MEAGARTAHAVAQANALIPQAFTGMCVGLSSASDSLIQCETGYDLRKDLRSLVADN